MKKIYFCSDNIHSKHHHYIGAYKYTQHVYHYQPGVKNSYYGYHIPKKKKKIQIFLIFYYEKYLTLFVNHLI